MIRTLNSGLIPTHSVHYDILNDSELLKWLLMISPKGARKLMTQQCIY